MPSSADYSLPDLLSSAGATIGVIIAGTIFLQFLSSKYVELANRYRELARDYRSGEGGDGHHAPLQASLRLYRRRLWLLSRASWLAAAALLGFLAAVLAGGLSIALPTVPGARPGGTAGLVGGLLLMAGGVAMELVESVLARHEIEQSVADLDKPAKSRPTDAG